ncbi:MAG: hypothetical protein QNJ91_09320 [Gammaproteobacteria bacterium]|nr:hypothetical protein [Gammaproteobacteria bacterium]
MVARVFWFLGAMLSASALLLMVFGGSDVGGVVDYRAWLLLAFGILAAAIGNFNRTSEP